MLDFPSCLKATVNKEGSNLISASLVVDVDGLTTFLSVIILSAQIGTALDERGSKKKEMSDRILIGRIPFHKRQNHDG